MAQSTVSNRITTLENTLGVSLFQRDVKQHVTMTADGKRLYQYAKDILDRCSVLEADMESTMQRELVIGASSAPSMNLMPKYIQRFTQERPNCCCILKSGDSEAVTQMLLNCDVQLGFVGGCDNRQFLTYEHVTDDPLVLITPNTPKYAEMQKKGASGSELLGEKLIFRAPGSATQKMVDVYLGDTGVEAKTLNVVAYADNPEVVQELVAQGTGVSIVSALTAQERVRSGRVLAFAMGAPPASRSFYMAYRKKGVLSDLAQSFAEMVRKNPPEKL